MNLRDFVLAALRTVNQDPLLLDEVRRFVASVAPAPPPTDVKAPSALTTTQLAARLGTSKATINRAAREGLPFFHVGSSRRFDLAAAKAWFEARPKRSLAPPEVDPDVAAIARRNGLRVTSRR